MILTLITVGKYLESRAKGKTSQAITKLINLAPKTAVRLTDGVEQEIPLEMVQAGDILAVKPGQSIPLTAGWPKGFPPWMNQRLPGKYSCGEAARRPGHRRFYQPVRLFKNRSYKSGRRYHPCSDYPFSGGGQFL